VSFACSLFALKFLPKTAAVHSTALAGCVRLTHTSQDWMNFPQPSTYGAGTAGLRGRILPSSLPHILALRTTRRDVFLGLHSSQSSSL
jgi:hypothetical protein